MSRRRRTNTRKRYWVVLAILALVVLGVIGGALWRKGRIAHRRSRLESRRVISPPAPRLTRSQAINLFRTAIERAGGDDAWVQANAPTPREAFNVLFLPRAYGAIDEAILRRARTSGLRVTLDKLSPYSTGLNSFEGTAYEGKQAVCHWTMREVYEITRVAIVIDDLGQNLPAARALLRLRFPLTFSVMPHLPYSRETADEAHRDGIEVMLHLPMQPIADSAPDVSRREVKVGMDAAEVEGMIEDSLATVPYAAGVNNHMGSRATSDLRLMAEVMTALARRHLYYIDSRTIGNSVAFQVARRSGVPAFYRSVFLDDTRTVPYTIGQLRELCGVAERQGAALAIGHPYPSTIAALSQFVPQLERHDIELVPASALLRQPEVTRLSPPGTKRL